MGLLPLYLKWTSSGKGSYGGAKSGPWCSRKCHLLPSSCFFSSSSHHFQTCCSSSSFLALPFLVELGTSCFILAFDFLVTTGLGGLGRCFLPRVWDLLTGLKSSSSSSESACRFLLLLFLGVASSSDSDNDGSALKSSSSLSSESSFL